LKAPHKLYQTQVSLHSSSSSSGLTRAKAQTFLKMQELHGGKNKKHVHSCAAIADRQFFHEGASPRTNLFYSSRRFEEPNEKNSREK
jgi:hypothetical protein